MEQSNAKNVFSRIGFAQVAGIIATMIVGRLVLTPLVTESNIEKTFEVVGASGLLLMIYIRRSLICWHTGWSSDRCPCRTGKKKRSGS